MKKAVILSGNKQYLVKEGDDIEVELINSDKKTIDFVPLLIINDEAIKLGKPELAESKVTANVVEADIKTDKVTSIRYKAKKRVRKVKGHRQRKSLINIKSINIK